jgi:sugar/nucleoside kinase (ribokinase family)
LKINDAMLRNTTEAPTSFTDVMTETGSGRRTFFYCPGANERMTEAHLQNLKTPAKIFCLGYLGFMPLLDGAVDGDGLNASGRLLREAQENGLVTAADLVSAPNPNLRAQVIPTLPWLDILFLNEWEAGQLLRQELPKAFTANKAKEFAENVRQLGVTGAVVLHCREGVVVVTEDGECLAQGSANLPDSEIQGTVGAGDALAAGVLLARHHEMPWSEALKLGVCAAAACLKSPTASDSVRPWKQCLELGNKYGFSSFRH